MMSTLPDHLQLAIFDMDGLLFDTEKLFMDKKGEVLRKYGIIQKKEDYIRMLGCTGDYLSAIQHEIYGPDYPEEEITDQTREAVDQFIAGHGAPVKPGIPELLEFFKRHGTSCCVATSSPAAVAASYIRRAGLEKYFDFIIGGDEIRHSKPDPGIFLAACEKGHALPERALVFEDSENGILAAFRAHIPVICIPDLKEPAPEVRVKTVAVCESAAGARKLLEEYYCSMF